MTRYIQSYEDLLGEKERLQALLKVQKEAIRQDIREIKEELEPIRSLISLAARLVTRDNSNPVLNAGANTLIDLVVKKLLLSRFGWLSRLVIPFLLKNYSSHFISENKGNIFKKLFSWIGKKNAKGHGKAYKD
jgi:hypothetical protein